MENIGDGNKVFFITNKFISFLSYSFILATSNYISVSLLLCA